MLKIWHDLFMEWKNWHEDDDSVINVDDAVFDM